jgi:hypothetical protein
MGGQQRQVLGVKMYTENGDYIIGNDAIDTLYFIEDIYNTSVVGLIKFLDTTGMLEFGPILGNERFEIKFGNTDNDDNYKVINLYGYKIKSIVPTTNTPTSSSGNFIEMVLVDATFPQFHNRQWSKAWTDEYIHTIVEDIVNSHVDKEVVLFQDYKKKQSKYDTVDTSKSVQFKTIENTTEKLEQFDTHLKTPAEGIQWLIERCSSAQHGQAGHLLYQFNDPDSEGFKFNFVSLESLLRQTKLMEPEGDRFLYVFADRNENYVNTIQDHKVSQVDYGTLRTLAGATYRGYDIRRKKLLRRDFTYQDAVDRFTILGKKTLFPDGITPDHHMTKVESFSDESMIDNLWYSRWIKQYCLQQTVSITVGGNEKRHAGGMIKIEWGSTDRVKGIINKEMDGKYLVKSVTHYFNKAVQPFYSQKLVCIKNGYKDSDSESLTKSVNRNI